MAYISPHTGPEIDAAVQMLGQVQEAREATSSDLAEVKTLATQVDDQTSQVIIRADQVRVQADLVQSGVAVVAMAREEVLVASQEAEDAKAAAALLASAARTSEQAASQSQIAAGISEQQVAELVIQVEEMISPVENALPRMVPLAATQKGQTAVWLAEGQLDAAGMAPGLREKATQDIVSRLLLPNSQMFPLMRTALGQVVLWLENGSLNGAGLPSTVRTVIREFIKDASYSTTFFPLMKTDLGQVAAWIKDGRFDAAGLDTKISEIVQAALISYSAKVNKPKHTDGSSLYLYRSKIAKIVAGQIAQARILYQGDSWSDHLKEIGQALADHLYRKYGQAGNGWVSMNADEGGAASTKSQLLNGARLNKSAGWTLLDMVANTDSLDGHAAVATGTAATISITNLKTQTLTLYYKDDGGRFRYSVDGGAPVVVAGGSTGVRKAIEISGLADAAHSIVIDLVGNTGTVTIFGGMATRTAPGVEFSKAGNGGSTAVQWNGIAAQVQGYASELKPDLVIYIMGTNDKNQGIAKAAYKAGVQSVVNAHQAGSPGCSVILMVPILSGSTMDLGLLAVYAEAMYEISQTTANVEYINLNAFVPPRQVTDALGLWSDGLHLSDVGGEVVAGLLMNKFLLTN